MHPGPCLGSPPAFFNSRHPQAPHISARHESDGHAQVHKPSSQVHTPASPDRPRVSTQVATGRELSHARTPKGGAIVIPHCAHTHATRGPGLAYTHTKGVQLHAPAVYACCWAPQARQPWPLPAAPRPRCRPLPALRPRAPPPAAGKGA